MTNHTFFNRQGVLNIRINLGKHNQRIEKSLSIHIGDLEIINNKVVGLSKTALLANSKIMRVESKLASGLPIEEAVKGEVYEEMDSETSFADMMDAAKLGKDTKVYDPIINRYREYAGDQDVICEQHNLQTLYHNREREQVICKMNAHWEGFIDFLADRGLANSSINSYLGLVKAVIGYARQYKGIEIPFNASVKVLEIEPYTWPVSVTERFLASKDRGPVIDAAKIMIYTCLRPSDCLKLRPEDFKQDRDIFYVEKINSKTQKVTSAPIPEAAWNELKECRWVGLSLRAFRYNLPNILKPFDQEAVTYEQRGNKIAKVETTLVEATTPKTLRKVGINRLAELGVDESVIRDFYSGHSSSKVFNRYYRNQELKKIM